MSIFHFFTIVQMVPNLAKHHIFSYFTNHIKLGEKVASILDLFFMNMLQITSRVIKGIDAYLSGRG